MKKKKSLSEAFNLFNYTDEMNCGESHDALYKKIYTNLKAEIFI